MKRTTGAPTAGARRTAALALCAATLAAGGIARAQPTPGTKAVVQPRPPAPVDVEGTVLELDKDDLVLDVGATAGVTESQLIDLWRPYKLKHPVSGKIVTDRFKIGQIQIGQVRPSMSLAKPVGALSRAAAPGDLVIFTRAPRTPATLAATTTSATSTATSPAPSDAPSDAHPTSSTSPSSSTPSASPDADAKAVTELFDSLRGQSIATRITRYEAFVHAHPTTRFALALNEEAAALRLAMTRAPTAKDIPAPPPRLVSGPGDLRALQGKPLRVAVELTRAAAGAVLHLRKRGDNLFAPLPMKPAGKGYHAVEIPADRIADRDLEYFIEAVDDRGVALTVVGAAASPERIRVTPTPPVRVPPSGTTSASVLTDFADYNRFRGNDWASQTEGTFGMRFKDLGIRAVRMGFGVYRGESGGVRELDEDGAPPRDVGLTYGHLEGELGMHRYFSLVVRLAVGLLDGGVSGGGQLFARIGNDRRTNLLLGGEILGGVGLRSIIELQLETFERFPILLRTEVTNQPAGFAPSTGAVPAGVAVDASDVAGRGVVQLGFRPVPTLTLAVRGSFQGRNINHAGPGFGGFVGYTW